MDTPETVPTWGYQPDGSAKIFDLAIGETLPEGWSASPAVIEDPSLATAEALTARAAGRAYPAPAQAMPGEVAVRDVAAVDPDALASAVAEIERLKGIIEAGMTENAAMVAEIETAEQTLGEAADRIAALTADLAKAQADGGFAVQERDAAFASLDALKAELDQVKADLDAATKPKTAAPASKAGK